MKSESKPRIAIVHPVMALGGGTEAITAWSIEALSHEFNVSLFTFSSVSAEGMNRYYGTSLAGEHFTLVRPPLPRIIKRSKRFSLLKDHLMMRHCKSVKNEYELFFGVGGMMEFGSKGMQYFGLAPESTMVKVLSKNTKIPSPSQLFRRISMWGYSLVSSYSKREAQKNLTLVTSKWAGDIADNTFLVGEHEVLYPPVYMPQTMMKPWEEREDGFLCVARVVPEKRLEEAIEIIKQVRSIGLTLSLTIVGRQDDLKYTRSIQLLAEENTPWVKIVNMIGKEELSGLMGMHKYGINTALDEPFGIAIAEMVKSGCVVFVANGGGQIEIVDSPRLTFDTVDNAAKKIAPVIRSSKEQISLREHLRQKGDTFSAEAFCERVRELVQESILN